MFQSSTLLNSIYPTPDFARPISATQAVSLRSCTRYDAAWSYRSATGSLSAALVGIAAGLRSWPVIQLYYSLFYSLRSILYSNDVCIYYCGKKPIEPVAKVGEVPSQLKFQGAGSSHIAAARVFRNNFPRHPLSGDIDFQPALDWMRSLREAANYNEPMMNLDDRMKCFDRVSTMGARQALNFYASNLNLYAFLPEDAVVALPFFAAFQAHASLDPIASNLISDEVGRVLTRIRDKKGLIKCMDVLKPKKGS